MKSASQSSSRELYGNSETGYKRFDVDTQSDKIHLNEATGERWVNRDRARQDIPLNTTTVEQRIEVEL